MSATFDFKTARQTCEKDWDDSVKQALCDYIAIDNMSPAFDKECLTNGKQDKAIKLMMDWVDTQKVPGLKMQLVTEANRTPLIFIEVEGDLEDGVNAADCTVMLYGHMDKQPPMLPWEAGLGPWTPVLKDGKLYGRGGADDGYAIFSSICALKRLKEQKLKHPRCVILVEASEESGSPDLPFYITKLKNDIGQPALIICLDSGCGNYEQLWLTTSLRGLLMATLRVDVLTEGVHSGSASGLVPSSFRVIRKLLDRIEDVDTGYVKLQSIQPDIPQSHKDNAEKAAAVLKDEIIGAYPFLSGMQSMAATPAAALLQKAWNPTISYTGISGVPDVASAGNVLRPYTTLNLSFRLPPTIEPEPVCKELVEVLTKDPPYGAKVTVDIRMTGAGWKAPELDNWLEKGIHEASQNTFGKPALLWGEGGSIPFMGMLGKLFPKAQFVITGVLGPKSNAHGPNEFLEINTMHNVTVSTAYLLTLTQKTIAAKSVGL